MIKNGISNYVTDGFRWRHLAFYEKDKEITKDELDKIHYIMAKAKSAYVVYSTDRGYHVMGLSPLSTISYAYAFKDLDVALKGNCSGHVLRINNKPNEKMILQRVGNIHDFPLCDQIYNYANNKFKLSGLYLKDVHVEKWKSLFCLYEDIHLVFRPNAFRRRIIPITLSQRREQSRRDKTK